MIGDVGGDGDFCIGNVRHVQLVGGDGGYSVPSTGEAGGMGGAGGAAMSIATGSNGGPGGETVQAYATGGPQLLAQTPIGSLTSSNWQWRWQHCCRNGH